MWSIECMDYRQYIEYRECVGYRECMEYRVYGV